MHITTIALITSIIGLISSFFLVGIIPSLVSFIMGIRLIIEEHKWINWLQALLTN